MNLLLSLYDIHNKLQVKNIKNIKIIYNEKLRVKFKILKVDYT